MKRNAFSMIELVFVIVILGVLAAVAVPRFVATRTDAQVATARSDLASVQKAVVAKVFADNIDPTASKVPAPNDPTKSNMITWSEWLIEVGGLDRSRWRIIGNGSGNNSIGLTANNAIQSIRKCKKSFWKTNF
ncbi:type II secretion system protein [Helicobacter sp. MIT 14-3879]|uniref:type II secretion system protein n=1 Tax=Helicobacter sp. MIT 14-3879 TaxID=2040649 RepID=UPI0015F18273|nr:type II secretion system protein [Helicobacter sp. MIT 14-3879]